MVTSLIYSKLTVTWFVDVILTVLEAQTSCLLSFLVPIYDIVVPYMKSRDYKSHNV